MPTKNVGLPGYLCVLIALSTLTTFQSPNLLFAQQQQQRSGGQYEVIELISDLPGTALHTDENLVNSWGIARSATGPWWINAAGTALSLVKNGAGDPFPAASPLIVAVPGATGPAEPTGIVFNDVGGFEVSSGVPAVFIFASIDGTISAWNPCQCHPSRPEGDNSGCRLLRSHNSEHRGKQLPVCGELRAGTNRRFRFEFWSSRSRTRRVQGCQCTCGLLPL